MKVVYIIISIFLLISIALGESQLKASNIIKTISKFRPENVKDYRRADRLLGIAGRFLNQDNRNEKLLKEYILFNYHMIKTSKNAEYLSSFSSYYVSNKDFADKVIKKTLNKKEQKFFYMNLKDYHRLLKEGNG